MHRMLSHKYVGRRIAVVIVVSVLALASRARAEDLVVCTPVTKYLCSPQHECRAIPTSGSYSALNVQGGVYFRCDAKGCDGYDATITRSGSYLTIDVPGRGVVAKVADDLTTYSEAATLLDSVYVSLGTCAVQSR
ncbi:hypothetical protein [Methylocaldum sp.]|uniref:hypothetical protein n=1 Tax=Methylocaldum sp. TaxID=1969727 RepID=UPI002D2F6232|nr:hypothetical protein [Methylocaldum sp.]HYE38199.1 hypothetical protein [Methylocaldum sp.]